MTRSKFIKIALIIGGLAGISAGTFAIYNLNYWTKSDQKNVLEETLSEDSIPEASCNLTNTTSEFASFIQQFGNFLGKEPNSYSIENLTMTFPSSKKDLTTKKTGMVKQIKEGIRYSLESKTPETRLESTQVWNDWMKIWNTESENSVINSLVYLRARAPSSSPKKIESLEFYKCFENQWYFFRVKFSNLNIPNSLRDLLTEIIHTKSIAIQSLFLKAKTVKIYLQPDKKKYFKAKELKTN